LRKRRKETVAEDEDEEKKTLFFLFVFLGDLSDMEPTRCQDAEGSSG
jgi:hypothetical protein